MVVDDTKTELKCLECSGLRFGDCIKNLQRATSCISPSGECFVFINSSSSAVHRGCVGKSNPFEVSNSSQCVVHKCSGASNCNNFEIQYERCHSQHYDRKSDKKPSPTFEMMCKLSRTPMGCYHSEEVYPQAEYVTKGCISNLYYADTLQHFEKRSNFRTCIGDLCNSKKTLPKCLSCTSSYSDVCVSDVENVEKKVCTSYEDQCYTRINEHDQFERGCLSDATKEVQKSCKSDGSSCVTCTDSEFCNNRTMNFEYCYVSEYSQDNVVSVVPEQSKRCPVALDSLGCYHLEIPGTKAIKKGCVAEFPLEHAQLLTRKDNVFQTCFGSNCNNKLKLERPIDENTKTDQSGLECIKCDSWSSKQCLDEPTNTGTCKSPTNECYTIFFTGTEKIQRGCVGEQLQLELPEQPTQFFQKCSNEAKCNVHRIIDEKCYSTEYKSGETFELSADNSIGCTQTISTIGCYHFDDSTTGTIKKGCVSDLSEAEITVYSTKLEFKTCSGNNCNVEQSCLSCSSTALSAECVTDLTNVESVTCSTLSSSCVVGIDQNGYTHRACSDMNGNEMNKFPLGHQICNGARCNNFVIPNDRLECYHCENCDPKEAAKDSHICSVYSKDDQCYTFKHGTFYHNFGVGCSYSNMHELTPNDLLTFIPDGKVSKGCLQENSDTALTCLNHPEKCSLCRENACNTGFSNRALPAMTMCLAILFVYIFN